VMSPVQWNGLALPVPLDWTRARFDEGSVDQIPADKIGVYSFVIEPNIANHPSCAYLMYIGQTTDQNFRTRYQQYLGHQRAEDSNRLLVQFMVKSWPDNLWFYYAPIDDPNLIEETEDQLLMAFKPPIPRAYPAELRGPARLQTMW